MRNTITTNKQQPVNGEDYHMNHSPTPWRVIDNAHTPIVDANGQPVLEGRADGSIFPAQPFDLSHIVACVNACVTPSLFLQQVGRSIRPTSAKQIAELTEQRDELLRVVAATLRDFPPNENGDVVVRSSRVCALRAAIAKCEAQS